MITFCNYALEHGAVLRPMIIDGNTTGMTGLMNPSILNDNGRMLVNIRHVNYTFYHSEKKLFQHPFGPLTYLHPEDDMHLRTWNWIGELDNDLNLINCNKIDTSNFVDQANWEFIGLEDVRLIKWDNEYYTTGVRRDIKPNGEGRMELCKIEQLSNGVWKETTRLRIEPPNDPDSYCEKNWMPILDQPFHYVKWSNPTEAVKIFPDGTSKTIALTDYTPIPRDVRGGSQVMPYRDGYLALTHEVDLFKSEVGRKDGVYRHRFIYWDKNWNIKHYTGDFSIMGAQVEFSVGMAQKDDDIYITFGYQDNAAYVIKTPITVFDHMVFGGVL